MNTSDVTNQNLENKEILDLAIEAELYYPENGLTEHNRKRLVRFARLIIKRLSQKEVQD